MTQVLHIHRAAPAARGPTARATASVSNSDILDLLPGSRRLLQSWQARAAYRRDLARLLAAGPHLVRDLGLDAADARAEIDKPFWRA